MGWGWYAGVMALAAADWLAVGFNHTRWRYFTKPAPMLALIIGFTLASEWKGISAWFGIGLVWSLMGDIFLMFPPSFFPVGLAFFLLAHITYIIGFNQTVLMPTWHLIFPFLALSIVDAFGYRRLRRSILCWPRGRWMRYPVLIYVVMISLMVFSALLTWLKPDWPPQAAVLVSLGALLFYISDTVLAFNRICDPIRFGRVIVITTYHLGQIALIAGVLAKLAPG